MDTFESLKRQVEQAQAQVDIVTGEVAAASLLVAIWSLDVLATHPRPGTTKRTLVAMPDAWLEVVARYDEASDAGLGYLACYLKRYGFVSIHAASRWLAIEALERRGTRVRANLKTITKTTAGLAPGFSARPPGAENLRRRLENRSGAPVSAFALFELVRDSFRFEMAEAIDRLYAPQFGRRDSNKSAGRPLMPSQHPF